MTQLSAAQNELHNLQSDDSAVLLLEEASDEIMRYKSVSEATYMKVQMCYSIDFITVECDVVTLMEQLAACEAMIASLKAELEQCRKSEVRYCCIM